MNRWLWIAFDRLQPKQLIICFVRLMICMSAETHRLHHSSQQAHCKYNSSTLSTCSLNLPAHHLNTFRWCTFSPILFFLFRFFNCFILSFPIQHRKRTFWECFAYNSMYIRISADWLFFTFNFYMTPSFTFRSSWRNFRSCTIGWLIKHKFITFS